MRRSQAADADRAADIVAKMSLADKIALACHDFAAVAHLGLPPLSFTDAGNGVRVADDATAFPVCVSLAATFDEQLAYRFGSAVGQEARVQPVIMSCSGRRWTSRARRWADGSPRRSGKTRT